jgi:alkaline phosphatase D
MSDDANALSRRAFFALGGLAGLSIFAPSAATQLGAGTRSRPGPGRRADTTYKYRGLRAMTMIDDGDLKQALRYLHRQVRAFPDDPEFLYGLAVAHAQRGAVDVALRYTREALDAGLPPGRFQAGPRELLAPLRQAPGFSALIDQRGGGDIVHGPLLGAVSDTEARCWVRTAREASVQMTLERAEGGASRESTVARTRADRDYTAVVRATGLAPDTSYTYRLRIEGREQPGQWSFRTFPRAGAPAAFEIGFGACAGYTPWQERMWRRIASYDLPLVLLLGDNVYIDRPKHPALQRYCYYRRQSRPEFRALTAGTSIAAIWDDHDFGDNNSRGGPARFRPAWKPSAWRTFRNNWNNVAYGGGTDRPGVWHALSIADVDIFMLDGRYYRTKPTADAPSMLGPAQRRWVLQSLRASTATFKLIASPVPFAPEAKTGRRRRRSDAWDGYPEEREALFSAIEDHEIGGVVLLSGDRHRADVWKIDRPAGYDLYEFLNGRLTNTHTHETLEDARFSYNETPHFGRLRIDTTRADPTLAYDIITIDGRRVHTTTLRRSQLTHS